MNFRRNIEQDEGGFQIAPMIDIVFIMLVFFVAISAMAQQEREIDVKPPVASSSSPIERKRHEIIINVKEDGTIVVNRMEWDLDKLRERLRLLSASGGADSSVMIRADALTAHQNVVSVIDACMDADMTLFSFITIEREDEITENAEGD
jgi:biopolymer transport protein ExbD